MIGWMAPLRHRGAMRLNVAMLSARAPPPAFRALARAALHITVIIWRCRWRLWWRRAWCGNRRLTSGTRRILWGRARL
jgi:hypothetical protein